MFLFLFVVVLDIYLYVLSIEEKIYNMTNFSIMSNIEDTLLRFFFLKQFHKKCYIHLNNLYNLHNLFKYSIIDTSQDRF